jgi:foldase protein PrsA
VIRAQRRAPLRAALSLALLPALIALTSCGGASHSLSQSKGPAHDSATAASQAATTSTGTSTNASTPAPPAPPSPGTLVASVAGKPIRFGEVQHLMAQQSAPEAIPDPPSYSGCIARAKAEAAKLAHPASKSEAELKEACRKRYEELLQSSISKAIHSRWLLGEAQELGISVSDEAVLREFDAGRKSFKSNAEFEHYRQRAGQSIPDMLFELKTNKLADAIFKHVKAKEHAPTAAQIAAYYSVHRRKFAVPEGRDVRILRTTTKAGAANAYRELKAGRSFAEVAAQLSQIGQPIGASHGIVKDLLPGVYEEKPLNDPIFSATLHRLYGPLQITAAHKTIAPETNSGFFIFEVTKTIAPRQTPLAKVSSKIAEELLTSQKTRVLGGFIASFRARWTARTDCRAGYVVRNCKQFTGAHPGREDPFTL